MGSPSRAAHYVLGYPTWYPWLSHMIPTVVFCHARYHLLHYTALSHTKPFLWLKILNSLPMGYGILYLRAC